MDKKPLSEIVDELDGLIIAGIVQVIDRNATGFTGTEKYMDKDHLVAAIASLERRLRESENTVNEAIDYAVEASDSVWEADLSDLRELWLDAVEQNRMLIGACEDAELNAYADGKKDAEERLRAQLAEQEENAATQIAETIARLSDDFNLKITERDKELAEARAEIERLKNGIKSLVGNNLPTAFDNEDDGVGHCPYCSGWNMHHDPTCEALLAQKLVEEQ